MAIYHLTYKTGTNYKHIDYINREGKYKKRDDLEYKESFNLPECFKNAKDFWEQAILNERKNGITYRELEIALPNEFPKEKNKEILEKFLEKAFGKDYVYNYAIHNPGGEQRHAHVMFCERKLDGIERTRTNFFKRYNPKNPEKGGAKKERKFCYKPFLLSIRKSWEEHLNLYLEAEGIEKISSDTLKKQSEKALEEGDLLKAELLKRTPYSYKLNSIYGKYSKKIKETKYANEKVKQQVKEIKKLVNNLEFTQEFMKQENKFKSKTFKEILKKREDLETNIFKLNKKMEDKNLNSKILNDLSGNKINILKNEKRKIFKKIKENKKNHSTSENKKLKKEIEILNQQINNIENIFDKSLVEEKMLKQKGKYMKAFKFLLKEKEIVDKIFFEKLKLVEKNSDDYNLYKVYVERKNLKEEREKVREEIFKNRKEIKNNLKERNFIKIQELKEKNKFRQSQKNSLTKYINKILRSFKADEIASQRGEFFLKDIKELEITDEYIEQILESERERTSWER